MANYGTILVVDDNPAILTAVRICLAGEFDKVLTLVSPDTLLTVLAQEEVDVILLDMNFTQGGNSGQDGLLWLRAIHKKHPAIPVVLVTAYADIKGGARVEDGGGRLCCQALGQPGVDPCLERCD